MLLSQAGTNVGPDQLVPPVRINLDRLGPTLKIGLGSTRIIKRKIKSAGITYLSPAILFFSHELMVA